MEPEKGTAGRGSGPKPENLHFLGLCKSLLRLRNYSRCRNFALHIQRSDPDTSYTIDRILAITDVHLAAERRLNGHFDWYAILQLRRDDSGNHQLIRDRFKKLAQLLNPNRNEFASSDEAFVFVRDAWRVLSDPEKKAEYEQAIRNCVAQEHCKQGGGSNQEGFGVVPRNGRNVNVGKQKATFWTMCPYCWCLHEYEKIYEDCSLRCQKCRRVFQGISVKSPTNGMLVKGKDQYYCYCAHVPLRYPLSEHSKVKGSKSGMEKPWCMQGWINNGKSSVGIPEDDDVDDSSKNCGIGEEERVLPSEQAGTGGSYDDLGNGKRRMRVKTVARNTKKMTGNRMRNQAHVSRDSDAEGEGFRKGVMEFLACILADSSYSTSLVKQSPNLPCANLHYLALYLFSSLYMQPVTEKFKFNSMAFLRQGMQFQNYYNSEAYKLRGSFSRGTILETHRNSFLKPKSKAEIKSFTAKKHSEAEKRRRMRINSQYSNLRTILLPSLAKTDKASVLAETIRKVKELKKNISQLEADSACSSGEITVFPSAVDKLNLEHCKDKEGVVKATLSCEDRPELMLDITKALRSVKAEIVKAEMVNVGRRTRNVLWVQGLENGNEGMVVLKRILKVAMHKPTFKMHRLIQ
ncbi:hypothetical protein K1719_017052 [Acacia pycnantha]|nr:hypothetical protein K1719_017052 [Acacia pycnantha]